ncbi:glycosyltransferase [Flavobacterium sp. GT3R68]|uniref:glycosyltransferase n=1 Tax=Flavobacterium sp. GT3R68 TaxID=2594437 RepID=UPI001315AC83|nr:glycosyltransferase [Flavobacterium sp. GT3R68]
MIKQNRKYKIALVSDCLSGGGAEKVHALLSIYFQKAGLEVHSVIFTDWVTYDYAGTLMNLGKVKPNSFFITRKLKRFFVMRKFIRQNRFDIVIDFRMRQNFILEFLLSKTVYPKNTIYTVHHGLLEYYFPKSAFLSRLIYKNRTCVTVSEAIRKAILKRDLAKKVDCIYNPIDFKAINGLVNQNEVAGKNYILAVGRMDDIKQFDKLIVAYSKSRLRDNNIKLLLLGEGKNKEKYINLVSQLGMDDWVEFGGFVANPFPYYKNALFLALCSKNEGFPNVLIECLSVGTPVVSFDCFTGPSEIIRDRENGLLVEDQNFIKLTEAMDLLAEDHELYHHCKANASQSVESFSLDKIGKQWLDYLKINVS